MANSKISRNIFFLIFATVPVLTAVVRQEENSCRLGEVSCDDGTCINGNRACDGILDCADRSDERGCDAAKDTLQSIWYPTLNRTRRQASNCRRSQWQCRDGSCIGFDGKCDGLVDCPDGSDETHALCRAQRCQSNWFRCTYGACVDGTAPCNGQQECADNSDELLPRCRNETDEIRGQFRCLNGQMIDAAGHCDGVADCPDGSDETVRSCAAKSCPGYLFQCAYGACVDSGADCNGIQECADGSDESDELCNRISAPTTSTTTTTQRVQSGRCVLPPYPEHGGYTVIGGTGSPGDVFEQYTIQVTCNPEYGLESGDGQELCFGGMRFPKEGLKCIRYCKLRPHPSVVYNCVLGGGLQGTRPCNQAEPTGTTVRPECQKPNYYYSGLVPEMLCIEGSWSQVVTCNPGLAKQGANVTILVKDTVEVHVGTFQYASPQTGSHQSGSLPSGSIQSVSVQTGPGQNYLGQSITPQGGSYQYGAVQTDPSHFDSVQTSPIQSVAVQIDLSQSQVESVTAQSGPIRPTKVQLQPFYTEDSSIYSGLVQPVRPIEPSTQAPFDYNIEESDWRKGANSSRINIVFKNDTKYVNDGAIYFRD